MAHPITQAGHPISQAGRPFRCLNVLVTVAFLRTTLETANLSSKMKTTLFQVAIEDKKESI